MLSPLTKKTVKMKVAHVKCTKRYTRGKSSSPRNPVVVKGTSHGYGGKNGHGGIGKREIRSQRVGSKSISIIHSYVINNNNNNNNNK